MRIVTLKSFGVGESGGNLAGVVLDAESLSDEEKQLIAHMKGFSETAFVERSKLADFKVRFFTPTEEVDLCGHATVAVYSLLFEKGLLLAGEYTQELKSGVLNISISDDGLVFMDQFLPEFSNTVGLEELNDVLSSTLSVQGSIPQIVSTGARDIFLPIENRQILLALKPDVAKLSSLSERTNTIGLHAFTLDTLSADSIAHSRNFAPLYGIPEESATGSSTGALACYLFRNGLLKERSLSMMRFEQGYSMSQPSEIFVTLDIDGDSISRVRVGGRAVSIEEEIL